MPPTSAASKPPAAACQFIDRVDGSGFHGLDFVRCRSLPTQDRGDCGRGLLETQHVRVAALVVDLMAMSRGICGAPSPRAGFDS